MTTALTGLQGAETIIDVVGNNVANSGTTGFKESDVLFATQFLQTQSIGSAPSADRGGTNPRQIGLGVKVAAINPNFGQGTIEISANPLDVAIQGDGFLIVQGTQGNLFTRNGQIQTNSANELVTVTGNRVLGFTVDDDFNIVESGDPVPLSIPLGESPVTQSTQNAYFSGVLTPLADVGDTPSIISSEVLGDVTIPFPPDTFDASNFQTVTEPDVASAGTSGATSGGGALTVAGQYRYRLTWYVDDGTGNLVESPPSDIVTVVPDVVAGDQVDLSNLPVDAPLTTIWEGRRIYRSIDGGDFLHVGDIADVTTTTFTNGVDAAGAALNASVLDQANYSYYVTFYNTTTQLESRPSERIGPLSSGIDGRIRIDNLPQPTGPFDAIRIYRNTASSTTSFRLLTTSALPAGTTTYIDRAADSTIVSNAEIDLMGAKASSGTLLTNVVLRDGDTYTTPFEAGTLSFAGRRGGRTLAAKEMTIDPATTTVQDLIDFMEESFGIITSSETALLAAAGGDITGGTINFTSNAGEANALGVALSSFRLTPTGETESAPISVAFTETQEANGPGSTTDFVVFDSLGIPINVRITTVLETKSDSSTTYRWFATSEDNEPLSGVSTAVGTGAITFDGNGLIIGSPVASVSVERNQTASESPLEFNLDFSQVSGLALQNSQGLSTSSMSLTRQDGFPPGTLSSFIITESGLIRGIFSNGAERPLGQIRMARFANNGGLQQVGENLFATGVNSGEPVMGNPGESGIGTLTAGALELSNTDIGQNLIELILASTQYRGGARVITTAQQLLDELLSLRR
jgi:flagellar hook protein FlgE